MGKRTNGEDGRRRVREEERRRRPVRVEGERGSEEERD